jgi:chromate transporter
MLILFLEFFKIGLFTFGGGYAMIPLIREVVLKHGWMTEEAFTNFIGVCESTPGPIAANMATYVGSTVDGFFGSVFATLGVVLPSFLIIFPISLFFDKFLENNIVNSAFVGIKCAVAFLITKAGFDMFKKIKKTPYNVVGFILITLLMIILEIFSLKFSSIILIIIGACLGLILYSLPKNKKAGDE